AVRIAFETDDSEIVGTLGTAFGDFDLLAPDIQADPLEVRVLLPLTYDAESQCFSYGEPKVTLSANWSFNPPLAWVLHRLLPDLNARIGEEIRGALLDPSLKRQIEREVNGQIRALFLKDGRIARVRI